MKIMPNMRLEAEGILNVLTYLDEKMLGLKYTAFNDSAGNKRRMFTLYLEGASKAMCEQLIFPGCLRVKNNYVNLSFNYGQRYRRALGSNGRIKIKLSRALGNRTLFNDPARQIDIKLFQNRLEMLVDTRRWE